MQIACLGWGSLIWDPRELPVRGKWFDDGPMLPIEFARQSSDGRITLVLVPPTFPFVRCLWKPMSVRKLTEARTALGHRESSKSEKPERSVDFWPRGSRNRPVATQVARWARDMRLDGVVWTNLPPSFQGQEGRIPTSQEVVNYLRTLRGAERRRSEAYIRNAPRQIDTDYRRAIERQLRWKPIDPA